MKNDQKKIEENEKVAQGRRDLLKKAVYVAPTLVVLGVLAPIADNAQSLPGPPGPPGPPGSI